MNGEPAGDLIRAVRAELERWLLPVVRWISRHIVLTYVIAALGLLWFVLWAVNSQ